MNKTSKKNAGDKCPSTIKVKDIHKNCILNESSHEKEELKNGLRNGIVEDGDTIVVKKNSSRNKKNKHENGEVVNIIKESESEEKCIIKTVSSDAKEGYQSSISKRSKFTSDNTVNNVDSNLTGNTKGEITNLDSNDNISCDENTSCSPQNETVQVNQVAVTASSSKSIHSVDVCTKLRRLEQTEGCVSEIAESLKNFQLEDTSKGTEAIPKESLDPKPKIDFIQYESELQMPMIMKIIQKDLSEPYSIYTYRYFIHNWPKLCFLAMSGEECVGAIVCKLDVHRKVIKRGYIAMLAVDQKFRKLRIGSNLVQMAINEMIQGEADEVVLETEVTNKPALQLYEKLGFVRDKRLFRYYLNGVDALRLKLWLR
ncbi:unnamed protein product [Phaedon cochleariae]|uniref:N-terminal methionine N(alpha)-acetyltransferase NatC n=1 Tax=Phaedon cochleariae TaxID=80249 RepID=A0A9P0DPC8_PHACE|nr:unnamed protein product [Phaedon cochleariae]